MTVLTPRTAYALQTSAPLFSKEFADRFLSYLDVAPASVSTYATAINAFLRFLSAEGISAPRREDIIRYKETLVAEGKKPTTIQTYLIAVRLFFRFLKQEGYAEDIAEHIKAPRLTKGHKKDYLTSAQCKDVLAAFDRSTPQGRRDYAAVLLMTVCGLRTIEVVRADVGDLRTLGDSTVLYVLGKGRSEKTDFLRIPPVVEKAIRESLKDRKGVGADAPLFSSLSRNNLGGRMTTRAVSGIAKEAFRAVGIDSERITAHSLRHTAVTLALLAGVPLEEVQAFARHSNIATTQIYAHNLDLMKNKSESAICGALFS